MFTGIIREVGSVRSNTFASVGGVLSIGCPQSAVEISVGDSIAVNGVCLTATKVDGSGFLADVSAETLQRSTLGQLSSGNLVNIELALAASGRLDGHIVQGHVDGTGKLIKSNRSGDGWLMGFSFPSELDHYIVRKGSIAVDGISLTVAELSSDAFSVAVIPHTYEKTRLKSLRTGDGVNLEVDILAKYVEKMLGITAAKPGITREFLSRHGFGEQE